MRPVRRKGVNKFKSARKFRGHTRRTNRRNVAVMRGGIRA